ncbi:hypothetical protein JKP88DRAFT_242086 [Tribonema minus]|uniref:Uncharacterized protein n=1 Tax=Tribonema minus TaxID=303371 RepID=A0A835YPN1_9STRA|nr:hypothetical protein JKP88DRAFT_242086 [Tribonema minus]
MVSVRELLLAAVATGLVAFTHPLPLAGEPAYGEKPCDCAQDANRCPAPTLNAGPCPQKGLDLVKCLDTLGAVHSIAAPSECQAYTADGNAYCNLLLDQMGDRLTDHLLSMCTGNSLEIIQKAVDVAGAIQRRRLEGRLSPESDSEHEERSNLNLLPQGLHRDRPAQNGLLRRRLGEDGVDSCSASTEFKVDVSPGEVGPLPPSGSSYDAFVAGVKATFLDDNLTAGSNYNDVAAYKLVLTTAQVADSLIPDDCTVFFAGAGGNPCAIPKLVAGATLTAMSIVLDQVDFHDSLVDGAQGTATYRNTAYGIANQCTILQQGADIKATVDETNDTVNEIKKMVVDLKKAVEECQQQLLQHADMFHRNHFAVPFLAWLTTADNAPVRGGRVHKRAL